MINPKVLNSKYFELAEAIYNQNISFAGFDYGYEETTEDNCTYLLVISNIFKSQNFQIPKLQISPTTHKGELPLKTCELVLISKLLILSILHFRSF
jgi:hypothetical protein